MHKLNKAAIFLEHHVFWYYMWLWNKNWCFLIKGCLWSSLCGRLYTTV